MTRRKGETLSGRYRRNGYVLSHKIPIGRQNAFAGKPGSYGEGGLEQGVEPFGADEADHGHHARAADLPFFFARPFTPAGEELICPATPENMGVINARTLALLPDRAIVHAGWLVMTG